MTEEEKENLVIEDIPAPDKEKANKTKKDLTFYESLKKGPLEKYYSHGVFPWKLIITIFIVIFTISQSVIILSNITSIHRAHIRGLYNLFIDDSDKTNEDYNRVNYFYTISELRNHIRSSINNYYNVKDKTLDPVDFPEGNPSPVAEFTYIDYKKRENYTRELFAGVYSSNREEAVNFIDTREYYYKLDNTTLGPFDKEDDLVKEFLNDVVDFRINYTLITKYPYLYEDNFECNVWKIIQTYSFVSRGHFDCTVDFKATLCKEQTRVISWEENFINKLLFIHIIVIVLACFSLYFSLRSVYTLVMMYMESKKKAKQRREEKEKEKAEKFVSKETESSEDSIYFNPLFDTDSSEEEESGKENSLLNGATNKTSLFALQKKRSMGQEGKKQFQFLQFWSVFIVTGNLLQILGSSMALSHPSEVTTTIAILIGSGCLFACFSVGKYIEYHGDYSTIYETLRRSFPVVIRYLLGSLPIFFGFLFLGVCIFWRSERFTSTSLASYSLFAMIQGDMIFDSFSDLSEISFFFGQIYLYSFCIIFIFITWNIFISIIEEAYVVTKIKNKTSWIYQYVELEPKLVDIKLHSKPSLVATKKYFEKMEKSSELLKKKLSKSLRTSELLGGKLKALDSSSWEDKERPRSISKKPLMKKKTRESKSVTKPYSFINESIPETDEFDLRFKENLISNHNEPELDQERSRKVSFPVDREKQIDNYFTKIENRFETIKKLTLEIIQSKKKRSSAAMIDFFQVQTELKQKLLKRITLIDHKAKDLRREWISNY